MDLEIWSLLGTVKFLTTMLPEITTTIERLLSLIWLEDQVFMLIALRMLSQIWGNQ